MAGSRLSVIVLCDAWRDAGRGAATAPLISPGEERREKEGGERRRGKGKRAIERDRKDGKRRKTESKKERGKALIFMNHAKAVYL